MAARRRAGGVEAPAGSWCALEASTADLTLKSTQSTFRQTERAFQASVVRYARLMGWAVYFVHDSRHSPKGWPDLVLIRRPRVVFAELKAERGRLTADQRECITELRACRQEVFVFRPSDWQEIERVLR